VRSKICFFSTVDPMNQSSWSGITCHMFRTLSLDHEVTWAGPVLFPKWAGYLYSAWSRWNRLMKRRVTSHNYLNAFFSAMALRKRFRDDDFDMIVIGAGEPELFAFLRTRLPVIYIADTTFALMVDYYPWHSGLCMPAIRQGNGIEQRAIKKAFHLIYSSDWAAASAKSVYGAGPGKITIAPFGASLTEVPSWDMIRNKGVSDKCHLLFLGSDWIRKGGPIAYEAYKLLKGSGLAVDFTIVGCRPELPPGHDVMVYPWLDKNNPVEVRKLYNIFLSSDIVISPSRADCTPVAFSEAAAFGIPVFTTDTGGISSIVKNWKNGFCLPYDTSPETFSERIREVWLSGKEFMELRLSSRQEYETRLNWEKWREQFNIAVSMAGKK